MHFYTFPAMQLWKEKIRYFLDFCPTESKKIISPYHPPNQSYHPPKQTPPALDGRRKNKGREVVFGGGHFFKVPKDTLPCFSALLFCIVPLSPKPNFTQVASVKGIVISGFCEY